MPKIIKLIIELAIEIASGIGLVVGIMMIVNSLRNRPTSTPVPPRVRFRLVSQVNGETFITRIWSDSEASLPEAYVIHNRMAERTESEICNGK